MCTCASYKEHGANATNAGSASADNGPEIKETKSNGPGNGSEKKENGSEEKKNGNPY